MAREVSSAVQENELKSRAKRPYKLFRRPFRTPKAMFWLLIPELVLTVAGLVLTALEQPDLFRTTFWQIGYDNGLNSNPNMILYAYANHRPLPKVPFVWSSTQTDFNVAITVLSLFVLIAKLVAMIMKVYYPVVGCFASLSMTALYVTSVAGWIGPDYADSRYPAAVVWYVKQGCDLAKPYNAVGYCHMALGTLAIMVLMVATYLANLILCAWSMWPNPNLDEDEEGEDGEWPGPNKAKEGVWEMQPQGPASPSPFTPRTTAFNRLNQNARFA